MSELRAYADAASRRGEPRWRPPAYLDEGAKRRGGRRARSASKETAPKDTASKEPASKETAPKERFSPGARKGKKGLKARRLSPAGPVSSDDDLPLSARPAGAAREVSARVEAEPIMSRAPSLAECTICLQPHVEPTATECGHVFCRDCLVRALRVKDCCPMCRHARPCPELQPSSPLRQSEADSRHWIRRGDTEILQEHEVSQALRSQGERAVCPETAARRRRTLKEFVGPALDRYSDSALADPEVRIALMVSRGARLLGR